MRPGRTRGRGFVWMFWDADTKEWRTTRGANMYSWSSDRDWKDDAYCVRVDVGLVNIIIIGLHDPTGTCVEERKITPDKIGDFLNVKVGRTNTLAHLVCNMRGSRRSRPGVPKALAVLRALWPELADGRMLTGRRVAHLSWTLKTVPEGPRPQGPMPTG